MVQNFKKTILIMLTAVILAAGSGFFVSYHHCSDCGSSDIAFFKAADCSCEDHVAHHNSNIDNCCTDSCEDENNKCSHHCLISGTLFSIPFFPIQKLQIPKIVDFTNFVFSQNLEIINRIDNTKKIILAIFDRPPIILQSIEFICFTQKRVFYH
ncbi:MAG: hypothetical protein RBS19_01140 [Bacteroidales bacterium]|nr:hypothetical protein [Bacteroidales bacterium]